MGNWRSGICPESELLARFKPARLVKLERESGREPLKWLLERLTMVRFFQAEKFHGNGPEKSLYWR